jgi:hypothetical protein
VSAICVTQPQSIAIQRLYFYELQHRINPYSG